MDNIIAHHPPADAQPVPEQLLPPPGQLSPALYKEGNVIWYGISHWPVWVSCPMCFPFQLYIQLTRWGEKRKTLALFKCCSATDKTLVCYQHCLSHKLNTQHYTGCHEESELHPGQMQHIILQQVSKLKMLGFSLACRNLIVCVAKLFKWSQGLSAKTASQTVPGRSSEVSTTQGP